MNSFEPVADPLEGRAVDGSANVDIMMGFAAHYIGGPLSRYYQLGRVLVRANYAKEKHLDD